jgi:hypothetical protein
MQSHSARRCKRMSVSNATSNANTRPAPTPTPGLARRDSSTGTLRGLILERDGFACRYCGVADYPPHWLILEHVDPRGASSLSNLVAACRSCNKLKGGRTPDEAGMLLGAVAVSETSKSAVLWWAARSLDGAGNPSA